MKTWIACVLLGLSVVGCGSAPPLGPAAGLDGGAAADGGATSGDGGTEADAGTAADAGDDGPDAGPLPDAGPARVPLNELGSGSYLGFTGGLYPNGLNQAPVEHHEAGIAAANAITPRDPDGNPSPTGKYVLLSIGMSNTTQEFCSQSSALPCASWSFMGQAAVDPAVNRTGLVLVNGAMGGRSAEFWDSPSDPDYDRVRDTRLVPQDLTEKQVQVVWLKVANPQPRISLPSPEADAYRLRDQMGAILRALKVRYPNVRQVFASSRIYAGYATSALNPEPYAYESGLAVKWLVEAQITQVAGGAATDGGPGDLDHRTVAPWVAWGPYLWADGSNARTDGLLWLPGDFERDGTHPAQGGERKVGTRLLGFFKNAPYTRCWFVVGGTCP